MRSRTASSRIAASLILLIASTACGDRDGSGFVVTDSAGVRLAANPGEDRPLPVTAVRVAELQPPDSALTAVPWGVAADPVADRIYVADRTTPRVLVFDGGGRYIRSFGRRGGGPGEFRSADAVAMKAPGVVAVWDARRGIISRWSEAGELLDEERAPVSFWGPGFALRGQHVLAVVASTAGSERRQTLVRATAGTAEEIFTLVRELVRMDLPGMSQPAPRIFAPDLIWTAAGDTVYVLNGPSYRIDAHVDGRLVASIRRALDPIPVTGAMAAARIEAGPYRGFMRRAGLTAEQVVAAVGYEETTSPVEWLAADPAGRLWVTRGTGVRPPDRVDLLAPDGRYLGTFPTLGIPVAFLADSTYVALRMTDLGDAVLELHRLRRAGASAP